MKIEVKYSPIYHRAKLFWFREDRPGMFGIAEWATIIEPVFIPTRLKARYGYSALGGRWPNKFGLQFDPFNDIAEHRLSDEVQVNDCE